jgi:hypothetical protein
MRGPKPSTNSRAVANTKRRCYDAPVSDERTYAILFAATILAARKLSDLGDLADRPCPARDGI